MSSSIDDLVSKLLDGDLTSGERAELEVYRESNVHARRRIEEAEAHLESLRVPGTAGVGADSEIVRGSREPNRPTPLRVRIMAGIILAILLFGLVMMPFISFKASLLEVITGDPLTLAGNPIRSVEQPAEIQIRAGEEATFLVRGRSKLLVRGPARLAVSERGPAALIRLVDGWMELERPAGVRECFCAIDAVELEMLPGGSSVRIFANSQGRGGEVLSGEVRLTDVGAAGTPKPAPSATEGSSSATKEGPGEILAAGSIFRIVDGRAVVETRVVAKPSQDKAPAVPPTLP